MKNSCPAPLRHARRAALTLLFTLVLLFGHLVGGVTFFDTPAAFARPPAIETTVAPDDSLRFHYPPRFAPAARILETRGPAIFHELEARLGLSNFPTVDVWLLPELAMYFDINGLENRAPAWAVGLSFSKQRTILVLHGIGPNREQVDTLATFAHELAHVAMDEATGEHRVPRWFNEGFAIMAANEWTADRSDLLSRAVSTGALLPFASLNDHFPDHHNTVSLAYNQSFHFVRHLESRFGERFFADITAAVAGGEDFFVAFERLTGERFEGVEAGWREELTGGTTFWAIFRDENVIFFGATLLFLVAFVVRRYQRRKQLRAMAEIDDPEEWDYDPSRYPLPGDSYRP